MVPDNALKVTRSVRTYYQRSYYTEYYGRSDYRPKEDKVVVGFTFFDKNLKPIWKYGG